MKKLLCLLAFLTATLFASAQINHDLTIYSEDGDLFTLVVNGQTINAEPATSVTAKDIAFDFAKVVIRFADGTTPDIERKNLQIAAPGTTPSGPMATVYKIKEMKGEKNLRFASRSAKHIQNTPVIIINNH